jgi:hypothetical protein
LLYGQDAGNAALHGDNDGRQVDANTTSFVFTNHQSLHPFIISRAGYRLHA